MTSFHTALFWECVESTAAWQAGVEERRAEARQQRAELIEREGAAARSLAAHLAKNAARRYRLRPAHLDAISPGLSMAPARRILAVVAHLNEARWGGNPLGTLVIPANRRGAMIYARWLRRFGERADFLEAAE